MVFWAKPSFVMQRTALLPLHADYHPFLFNDIEHPLAE